MGHLEAVPHHPALSSLHLRPTSAESMTVTSRGLELEALSLAVPEFLGHRNGEIISAHCLKLLVYFTCLKAHTGPALCNPVDGSPSGSSVHGILQATILEWVAMPFYTEIQ